jgi:hypothetical protein
MNFANVFGPQKGSAFKVKELDSLEAVEDGGRMTGSSGFIFVVILMLYFFL